MRQPVDIPGYYYDKEKAKYFKIEGSGNATKSAYTPEAVKKRQARDLEEETQIKKAKRGLTGIRRAINPDVTISGFTMSRENGNRPDLDNPRRILAEGLVRRNVYLVPHSPLSDNAEPLFCVQSRGNKGGLVEIHCATNPRLSSDLIKFKKSGRMKIVRSEVCYCANCGQTTSLSIHEGSRLCATTWLSGSTETGITVWGGSSSVRPVLNFGSGIARGQEVDLFSSTAAPSSSSLHFAFGTSRGILTLDAQAHNLTWCQGALAQKANIREDYLALSFLGLPSSTSSGQSILCGGRSGLVRHIDLRDSSNPTEGAEHIRHPSTVTHIKQVSEHGILISGLQNHLQQYDLRFLKPLPFSTTTSPTTPILLYPHYKNSFHISIGLDIDLESGIIACAQESNYDFEPRVQLLSLTTGQKLRSPAVNKEVKTTGSTIPVKFENQVNPPRCVKWNKDVEEAMKSLYVSDDTGAISRYVWGGEEDED